MGSGHVTPSQVRTGDIVLPPIRRAPDLPIELSGLLPNRDHNGDLLVEIERMPTCLPGERPVIGILAADPFLRIDQLSERLSAKGYQDLANLPSAAQYGASFRAILDDLNVGPGRERQVLRQFRSLGFAVSATVADADDIADSLALEPQHLFVAPDFDLWNDGVANADALLTFCSDVAARREKEGMKTPIVLFAGRLGISAEQALDAGADGVLLD